MGTKKSSIIKKLNAKSHRDAISKDVKKRATHEKVKNRKDVGDVSYESGPDGMFPSNELSESLKKLESIWSDNEVYDNGEK